MDPPLACPRLHVCPMDNRLVAFLHITLRDDALVGHPLLRQEMRGDCLLEVRSPLSLII